MDVTRDGDLCADMCSSESAKEGVAVKRLKSFFDDRGCLTEILRCDESYIFNDRHPFGQVYCTTILPGVVKAWHRHSKQMDRICCVRGMIRLGIVSGNRVDPYQPYDPENNAPPKVIYDACIGDRNPCLVTVPPGMWHGFKNVGTEEAFVINIPDKPYDHKEPDEERKSWIFFSSDMIKVVFDWETKNR